MLAFTVNEYKHEKHASNYGEFDSVQDGFFSRLLDQDFVLVLETNSTNCEDCESEILRNLSKLGENKIIKRNKVDLVYLNSTKTDFFKNCKIDIFLYVKLDCG